MRTLVAVISLLLLTGAAALAEITVVSVRGDIKVRRGAEEQWHAVAAGDVVKPEDSMMSGRASFAILTVDGATRLALPEMVIVDCSDLRTLTQEELLLKLAMEGIRALPQQKRGGGRDIAVPKTTTTHGARNEPDRPLSPGSESGVTLQLNGTKVLHRHGFFATMVLRAKEVFRLAPELQKRTDVRLMVADAFEQMRLTGEALGEYRALAKEKLTAGDRSLVEGKIAELKKKQKG
jgi:hypothetical protein